ncbi:hypothetical protein SLEP1_g30134 [Rubroshorea leprosula]|uniref:Phosphoglycerate mutase-like protein n=1 Tax=Rubroshorea leprosula TaxID=152421 RepID=A0AAV5K7W4_9ROSI|nr:hypothetical protein SLEP1_g30134 [Rubroshorea leprosula]
MDTATAAQPHDFKILHLVRHAQGIHNVAAEENTDALKSYDLLDAPLSTVGWQQVRDLRKFVYEHGLVERIELVITSPMLRTIQTAIGVFGSKGLANELDGASSTMDQDQNHTAIASFNCIPVLAVELCRERLIESEDDSLWTADRRETHEEVAARGVKFIKWLWTRKEKEIAIVSHGVFLQDTVMAVGAKSNLPTKTDLFKRFQNCELRSVIITGESLMSLDSLANGKNSGRIQYSLQLPNAAAKENITEKEH